MKIADFFCGIGGIRLGFERANSSFKNVFSNEIDKKAIVTYEANFKDGIPVNSKSISDLKEDDIPNFDILLAGFPCQSFSLAGNKKGFNDPRGNLFFEIIRILKMKKPAICLLENVKNIKTHNNGNTFKTILEQLTKAGYHVKFDILNSCLHGNVPQNRERIFIIGFLNIDHYHKFEFPSETKLTKQIKDCIEDENKVDDKFYYTNSSKIFNELQKQVVKDVFQNQIYQYRRTVVRENKSDVCPTLTANMGVGGHNVPIIRIKNKIRKLTPRECLRFQSFPENYILPNISNCHLYKQIGNSVTVSVIERIAKNIYDVISKNDFSKEPKMILKDQNKS